MMESKTISAQNRLPLSPLHGFRTIWTERQLVNQLVRRSLSMMYSETILGIFWSFARPLFLLAVYTMVFGIIFRANFFPNQKTGMGEFAVILLLGLTIFGIFSETVSRSSGLMVGNANLIKKVVFPIELLPVVDIIVVIINALFGLVVFSAGYIFIYKSVPFTVLLLPMTITPLVMISLGVSYFVCSLSVYIRDVGQIIGILVSVLLFVSPIFYPLSAAPETIRGFMSISPLAFALEASRSLVFDGNLPRSATLAVHYAVGFATLWAGWAWFQFTRRGFADVL